MNMSNTRKLVEGLTESKGKLQEAVGGLPPLFVVIHNTEDYTDISLSATQDEALAEYTEKAQRFESPGLVCGRIIDPKSWGVGYDFEGIEVIAGGDGGDEE